jgi:hypothetical protein
VRIGLHTGEPRLASGDYVGLDVHRAARICAVAHGGQVIVSETTKRALAGQVTEGIDLLELGEHWLKDLSNPLRLHQVVSDDLMSGFPPPRALARHCGPVAERPTPGGRSAAPPGRVAGSVAGYGGGELTLDVDVGVGGDVDDDSGDVLPPVNSTLGWYSLLTALPPS